MYPEAVVEQMIIDTLVANGWEFIPADQLPRSHNQVMVEPMVRDALMRLNPGIKEANWANEVIIKLRPLFMNLQANDLVTRNEVFKKKVFEENSYPFGENHRMVPVTFFGMGNEEELAKNSYIVTNQWVYPQGNGGKRLDIVLLVNGFPIAVGEIKTPVHPAISWIDGAEDILDYEQSIPQMFVANVFNFATEGKCFRYGSVKAPVTHWGPWHTPFNKAEGSLDDVRRSLDAMIRKDIVLDVFRFFTLFSTTPKHQKYKVICRYQQYEGANAIVERVRRGYPKKGLIWHFQGSGKSLLMVFAAQKLRMMSELANATVVIVLDRIDLKTQLFTTFSSAGVPNLVIAEDKKGLVEFFRSDTRKVLITTIFLFDEVETTLNPRQNIIVLVDEAHRTQEGQLGIKMRLGLPNAYFFGLTGTPINRLDHNTFITFGAVEDKTGYLSKYSFSDSIRDGATLPLNFETVPVELHIDQTAIDEAFARLTDGLTEQERNELATRVRMSAIIKTPARIEQVCRHIYEHFNAKVDPNGFKGQVVCYDRACCLLYKEALDRLFGSTQYTEIVMDTNNDKEDQYKPYRRSPDEEARILDNFRDSHHPLKLLIVTSKLLTGFDAPILQAMYLDKPMKDHTLLQAICRTNRVYGDTKTNGLIVDYIGIFDKFATALHFDEDGFEKVITNVDEVKRKVPELVQRCLAYFPGVNRTLGGWEGLAAAQNSLPNQETRDKFGADYRVLHKAWNVLSPDICLEPHKMDYRWLSSVYESVRPTDNTGHLIWSALGPKTLELIQENVTALGVKADLDVLETDANLIEQLIKGEPGDFGKQAKKIQINLEAIIRGVSDDPIFIALGERLEKLKEQHEQGLIDSVTFLKSLLDLARDTVAAVRKAGATEQEAPREDKGKAALTMLFRSSKNPRTPIIVERIVDEIDSIVRVVRFPGWQDTVAGRRDVSKELYGVFARKKLFDKDLVEKAYGYVEMYY